MQETEIKFLDINKKEIIDKLEKLKAKKTFEGDIESTFYDFPDKNLERANKYLRLRKKGNEIELTSKERIPHSTMKVMAETEVTLNNFETAKKLLKSLGLKETRVLPKKHRITYSLNNCHFEIEKYDNVPTFLEIEAANEKSLNETIKLLNLDIKKGKDWSNAKVLEFYGKK